MEELGRGRSAAWLWRQVIAAILVDGLREVRLDPGRAIGMCVVLLLVSNAAAAMFMRLSPHPTALWILHGPGPSTSAAAILADVFSAVVLGALSGWLSCAVAGRLRMFTSFALALALSFRVSFAILVPFMPVPVTDIAVLALYLILLVAGVGVGSCAAFWMAPRQVRS